MRVRGLRRLSGMLGIVFGLVGASAQSTLPAQSVDPAYLQKFEQWRRELVEDRKQNWLTLVGLFWLKPGENSFGTDAGNAIVFPPGSTTAHAGSLRLQGDDVEVTFLPGANGAIDGKPVKRAKLGWAAPEKPTVLELGSLRFFVIQRGQRVGLRVRDLNNPATKEYRGAIFYPLNLTYRITAAWVPADGNRMVDVPNVLGDVTHTKVPGEARFTVNGQEVRLSAVGGDPGQGLSFIFSDGTR